MILEDKLGKKSLAKITKKAHSETLIRSLLMTVEIMLGKDVDF